MKMKVQLSKKIQILQINIGKKNPKIKMKLIQSLIRKIQIIQF